MLLVSIWLHLHLFVRLSVVDDVGALRLLLGLDVVDSVVLHGALVLLVHSLRLVVVIDTLLVEDLFSRHVQALKEKVCLD